MTEIEVFSDGDHLMNCNWIYGLDSPFLIDEDGELNCLLDFQGVTCFKDINIKKQKIIELKFCFRDIGVVFFFSVFLKNSFIISGTTTGDIHGVVIVYNSINMLKLEILKGWSNNSFNFNWRNLSTNAKKREWLYACVSLPSCILYCQTINFNKASVLKGKDINSEEDLYCTFGESVFGVRGYIGQDLEGLRECLGILNISMGASLVVKIEDSFIFNKKLKKFSRKINYTEKFYEVLAETGCYVVYERPNQLT